MRNMLTAIVLAVATAASAQVNSRSFLPGINLDSWTQTLVEKAGPQVSPALLLRPFQFPTDVEILRDRRDASAIFADLLKRLKYANLTGATEAETARDFANLARGLENVRQLYRYTSFSNLEKKRRILYLLQILSEEVAYVGLRKFAKSFPSVIRTSDLLPQSNWAAEQNPRSAEFFGYIVIPGDIVLSNAVGSVSSELSACMLKSRQIFSHATVIGVTANKAIVSPEALIQDGLKLRLIAPEYETTPPVKSRVYIYRYIASHGDMTITSARIEAQVDRYIQSMYKKVKSPLAQPVSGYDLTMDPVNIQNDYFGVTVIMKILGNFSPWATPNWSQVATRGQRLLAALGVSAERIPSPGDMEFDHNYELVGSVVNVSVLPQERIEGALTAYILNFFSGRRSDQLLDALTDLRTRRWTPHEMAELERLHVLPQVKLRHLQTIEEQVPPGLNPRQAALFYFLDDILAPAVEAKVQAQIGTTIVGYDALYGVVAHAVTKTWQEKLDGLNRVLNGTSCKSMLIPNAPPTTNTAKG